MMHITRDGVVEGCLLLLTLALVLALFAMAVAISAPAFPPGVKAK